MTNQKNRRKKGWKEKSENRINWKEREIEKERKNTKCYGEKRQINIGNLPRREKWKTRD